MLNSAQPEPRDDPQATASHPPGALHRDAGRLRETVADVEARVRAATGEAARAWLEQARTQAAAAASEPSGAGEEAPGAGTVPPGPARRPPWQAAFASAGRHVGRSAACDARVLLLHAARPDTAVLTRLYQQGTTAERTAVLRALPHLPAGRTPHAVPLVEDALRTNDTVLIAAAAGPYAAEHLDAHGWRHAVLKCLFTGVPLDAVAGLRQRARDDAELARMLRDFAHERLAAGRPVPPDLHLVLDLAGGRAQPHGRSSPHPPEES